MKTDYRRQRKTVCGHVLPGLLFLVTVAKVFGPFRFPSAPLSFYSDDFFYYLKVAESIARRHLSTFDGSTLTNGYHPLWMVVLVGLLMIFKGKAFFTCLGVITTVAVMVLFYLCRKLCQLHGTGFCTGALASFFVCYWAEKLMLGGMEVVVALPLLAGLVVYISRPNFRWESRQCLIYGFLASLAVLGRLDIALFLLLLLGLQVLSDTQAGLTQWLRRGILFGAGGGLLPLYFAANWFWFSTFTPVSSTAKHLKHGISPALGILADLLPRTYAPGMQDSSRTVMIPLIVTYVGLALWGWRLAKRLDRFSPVIAASLTFPFFYVGILSLLSDWPLWPWYYYPLTLSCTCSLILCFRTRTLRQLLPKNPRVQTVSAIVLVVVFAAEIAYKEIRRRGEYSPIHQAALAVAAFDKTHHGRYAMGDRAGVMGYVLPDPLIQLEGLVMDKTYLSNIRAERNLIDVLHNYHTDYYIATNPEWVGACYRFAEPSQAGPASPKMRGEICSPPLLKVVYAGKTTAVFAVPPLVSTP